MIQETSLAAYQEIKPELGHRQKEVLEVLRKSYGMTNGEIASFMNRPINTITPRIFELRAKGLVSEKEKRPCKSTGRKAIVWMVNSINEQTQLL